MPSILPSVLAAYAVGVAIGLVTTEDRPLTRITLALLWPVGPFAFLATITVLLLAAPIALVGRRTS